VTISLEHALGIYVHLPFCPYICPYCDFAKWPLQRTRAAGYLQALRREIEGTPAQRATTIFFGGGTPNAYDATDVAALTSDLVRRFSLEGSVREVSIELNPDLVKNDDVAQYVHAGINRVSIGVQSFEPGEVRTLGRRHSRVDVERAFAQARAAGVASVSIDLMFGVPGQTPASWERSLDAAIALGPDHVSTYGLTIEEGTPYFAWRERSPEAFATQDDEAAMYGMAIERLEAAGFEHYEISNFARPGHACAHNQNYWANGPYLGFGVGAASYREGVRSVHTRVLDDYVTMANAGAIVPAQSEHLEGDAAAGEAIMLALRTAQGVDLRGFKERYGIDVRERFDAVVATFVQAGFLTVDDARMTLTRRGRFLANDVCAAFVSMPDA
jgi:oxygen-independent coproporphyrinogen III oxidase